MDWFKKYFIPRESNEHQPYFLREGSAAAMLVLIILLEAAVIVPSFFLWPHSRFWPEILPQALLELANEERLAAGLPPLKINPLLNEAAERQAEEMAARSHFAHENPDGLPPWRWLEESGYRFAAAGQNIAVSFFDVDDAASAWRRLADGRPSALHSPFTEIGIGAAPGRFRGRDSVYVVEFLARPALADSDSESVTPAPRFSNFQLLGTRLHLLSRRVYFAMLALVGAAFLLNLFINPRIQHLPIIINGLLLMLVIFGVLFINDLIFTSQLQASYLETTFTSAR